MALPSPLLSTHPSARTLDLGSSSHLPDTSVLVFSEPQMAAGSTGAVLAEAGAAARQHSLSFPFVCPRTLWHGCHRLNLKFTVVLRELLVPPSAFIVKTALMFPPKLNGISCSIRGYHNMHNMQRLISSVCFHVVTDCMSLISLFRDLIQLHPHALFVFINEVR